MLVPMEFVFLLLTTTTMLIKTTSAQESSSTSTPPFVTSTSASTTKTTHTSTQTPTPRSNPHDSCHAHPPDHGPPLPILDRQFSMTVEATIKEKNYTMTMELHYDYVDNKVVLFISKNGMESRLLYNFPLYESYYIQNDSCKTMSLRNRHKVFQWINYKEIDGVGHVSDVHDVFNFGTTYNETYVPTNVTVRGMPVDQWTSCVERDSVTYRLDYYFTQANYSAPCGSHQVPVRAVLTSLPKNPEQSTKNQYLEHVYDFMSYRPGPCDRPEVFLIPRGSVCDTGDAKKTQPILPDHFSMGVEVTQPAQNTVSYSKQYFDYTANLTCTDITPSKKSRGPFGKSYGGRPLKVIHDYSTGLQYVIDMAEENCSVQAIPNNSVDASSTDSSHVHMRHGADMFSLSKKDLKYQGKRMVRDIECDVWSAVRSGWLAGVNTTIETCWVTRSQLGGLSDNGDPTDMILIQIWLRSVNKKEKYSSDYISNMFNYEDSKPDLGVFDIANCFVGESRKLDVIFRVTGLKHADVRPQPHHLQVAVRDAISKAAHVSPIRVNNIFFATTSSAVSFDVWLTIYDAPAVKGDVDKPVPQVSLRMAYKNLKTAINNEDGLKIVLVSELGSQTMRVLKGSVKTIKDTSDPRLPFVFCDHDQCGVSSGHSSGSMAALGIMMLVLGVVFGLVAAFFLWKRGTGIPYQVQN